MSISNPDSRYQPHLREFAGLSLAGGAATGVASWGTEHHSTGGLGGLAALDRGVALLGNGAQTLITGTTPLRPMTHSKKMIIAVVIAAAILLLIGLRGGWFATEPAYGRKTVTAWLDSLLLSERRPDSAGNVQVVLRSPEGVANDPALHALLKIGSNAVPILVQRIYDRAEWPREVGPIERMRMWGQWTLNRLRGRGPNQRPSPRNFSEFQRARKNAAGFALLALGTNANGGFTRYMEAYAAAPKHESIYGTKIAGPPVGSFSSDIVCIAKSALPQRRDEIFEEILKGLHHTNAWCRTVAIECVVEFPEEIAKWKNRLAELTQDEEPLVQEAALGGLILIVQKDELR